jgi:hypothetical protein
MLWEAAQGGWGAPAVASRPRVRAGARSAVVNLHGY